MFISGASRGIGLAIAKRAAQDGANIALIAKTAEPHPKLPGTVYTAAKELEEAGGQALPIVGDVRDPDSVESRGGQGRRAVRRHRHLRQQRVGDQPGVHHRGADEALRLDERHPGARHVRGVASVHPPYEGPGEPAHPDAVAAGAAGQQVAEADGVHDGEVRYDAVRAGDRRGDARRGHRLEHAVAAHAGGHRRGAEPARR